MSETTRQTNGWAAATVRASRALLAAALDLPSTAPTGGGLTAEVRSTHVAGARVHVVEFTQYVTEARSVLDAVTTATVDLYGALKDRGVGDADILSLVANSERAAAPR